MAATRFYSTLSFFGIRFRDDFTAGTLEVSTLRLLVLRRAPRISWFLSPGILFPATPVKFIQRNILHLALRICFFVIHLNPYCRKTATKTLNLFFTTQGIFLRLILLRLTATIYIEVISTSHIRTQCCHAFAFSDLRGYFY